MPLPSFTVTGNLNDILPTPAAGEIADQAWTGAYVIFASNLKDGVLVWAGEIYNRPPPVKATIGGDGSIKIGGVPVELLANDPGLNVAGVQWRCDIKTSSRSVIASFWFTAPTDGGTVNLATVAHVPSASVNQVAGLSESSIIALIEDPDSDLRGALEGIGLGGGGGGLADIVADTTPQLGGDLDLNGHKVGAATAADLTKLHGAGALSGNNTGDQDLSGYATTSYVDDAISGLAGLSLNGDGFWVVS